MPKVEEPNASLLKPEEAASHAQQHFGDALSALRDMISFGTHLIIRAYNSSDHSNVPMVVLGVLLKQLVAMLDAAEILVREGHSYPALLQLRAAFEASIYVDWILKTDSENRARHYIVANLRDEAIWAKRGIGGTAEKEAFDAVFPNSGRSAGEQARLESDGKAHLAQVNALLVRPEFQCIDAEFTRRRGKRDYDPAWHQVLGFKSLRQVADDVSRLSEYQMMYGRGSEAMHSGLYKDHIRFHKGGFKLLPLRHLRDANSVLRFAMMLAVRTYRLILERYRPDELEAFGRRYEERWRQPFWSVPEVEYKQ
jgi:hypothetical protein